MARLPSPSHLRKHPRRPAGPPLPSARPLLLQHLPDRPSTTPHTHQQARTLNAISLGDFIQRVVGDGFYGRRATRSHMRTALVFSEPYMTLNHNDVVFLDLSCHGSRSGSGRIELMSDFSRPWDASHAHHHSCGLTNSNSNSRQTPQYQASMLLLKRVSQENSQSGIERAWFWGFKVPWGKHCFGKLL